MRSLAAALVFALLSAEPVPSPGPGPDPTTPRAATPTLDEWRQEVWRTEEAFAKTMADRDFAAFQTFLSPETVFWSGGIKRGPAEVAATWKRFYEGREAPFSWKPDTVEVLESGSLAFSSGPVFDPEAKRVSTFNSVWRREGDGKWRVVFDKGCPPCEGGR